MSDGEQEQERLAAFRWLASPEAAPPMGRALALLDATDPLAASTRLRREFPDLSAGLASACLEQAALSRLAAERYGLEPGLLLTRDGLEAATRPEVAGRRAALLRRAGAHRVLDLTGGLGLDTRAFLAAGMAVTAVERDPVTVVALTHNCPDAQVVHAESTAAVAELLAGLAPQDVVFVDPARRDPTTARDARTGRARPERDPERWSPPWSFVAALPHPRVAAKLAPGFTPPPGWHAEWVSVDRTVVECAVYSWPALPADRQAVVFTSAGAVEVAADGTEPPWADALGAWLFEPDPAIIRAAALGALARSEGLSAVDPDSTWLTGTGPATSPTTRAFRVITELTGSPKQQRRTLADAGVRRLTVKSRDVDVEPGAVMRSLGVTEGPDHVLVMTQRAGRTVSVLTEPARSR